MQSFRGDLRAIPRSVWILLGGTFINRFGTFVLPFLILYLTRIGYTSAQAGFAVGVYGLGHVVASSAGGHLADRIGRRNTIVVSMFGSCVAMLALSQARAFAPVAILTGLAGAFAELYRPASYALVGDLVPEEVRVTAFGLYRFAVNLGVAAGPATAGFVADRSFILLFLGDALTSLVFGLVALFALPHGLRTYTREERTGEAARTAFRDRAFVLLLAATFCNAIVDFQMGSTFALHVTHIGLPASAYGMLISLNGLLIVLTELAITRWTRRQPPRPMIALGYFLGGAGFALTGVARTFPALAATVVVWTVGEMVSSPVASSYAVQLAPEKYRGRYMGLLVMMWSTAMVFGPAAGTLLFARNPAAVWITCGLLGTTAAALMLIRPRAASV